MARPWPDSTLDIASREEDGTVRLYVSGDLDRGTAYSLTAAVIRTEVSYVHRLVIDLRELSFVDAGGLRTLTDLARRTRRRNCDFVLANPPEPIARLLRLTGLDQSFEIVDDRGASAPAPTPRPRS